jgi:hypothetical protein
MLRAFLRAGQVFLAAGLVAAAPCFGDSIAHWTFDEGGGSVAFDVIGSADGALAGSASLAAVGIAGGALSLDRSTGDYVDMGPVFGFTGGDFSISVWVRTTTQDIESVVVGRHQSGVAAGYFICVNASSSYGEADKAFFYQSPDPGQDPVSTTSVNDDTWHNIVAVYHAGGTAEIFVDGSPAEDAGTSASISPVGAVFMVGGITYSSPTGLFTGLVDDLQLYDHALSADEIDFLFAHPGVTVDRIFTDGFESGDTTAWSSSAP